MIPALPATTPRIVLDTNVCLDLFVFHDPRWSALLAAIESGAVQAVTRADCRMEYLLVLHYPHLPLDEHSRATSAVRFDALITVLAPAASGVRLPVCSDKDDQKFLELARDAGAATLITKDKALLKLARKTASAGLFEIVLPQAWRLSPLIAAPH
jgi:putative PIN family toxin of toxin-antitoxin system